MSTICSTMCSRLSCGMLRTTSATPSTVHEWMVTRCKVGRCRTNALSDRLCNLYLRPAISAARLWDLVIALATRMSLNFCDVLHHGRQFGDRVVDSLITGGTVFRSLCCALGRSCVQLINCCAQIHHLLRQLPCKMGNREPAQMAPQRSCR